MVVVAADIAVDMLLCIQASVSSVIGSSSVLALVSLQQTIILRKLLVQSGILDTWDIVSRWYMHKDEITSMKNKHNPISNTKKRCQHESARSMGRSPLDWLCDFIWNLRVCLQRFHIQIALD